MEIEEGSEIIINVSVQCTCIITYVHSYVYNIMNVQYAMIILWICMSY